MPRLRFVPSVRPWRIAPRVGPQRALAQRDRRVAGCNCGRLRDRRCSRHEAPYRGSACARSPTHPHPLFHSFRPPSPGGRGRARGWACVPVRACVPPAPRTTDSIYLLTHCKGPCVDWISHDLIMTPILSRFGAQRFPGLRRFPLGRRVKNCLLQKKISHVGTRPLAFCIRCLSVRYANRAGSVRHRAMRAFSLRTAAGRGQISVPRGDASATIAPRST